MPDLATTRTQQGGPGPVRIWRVRTQRFLTASAVLIAVLSFPLVSIALESVGRAPLLEDISRGLLGLIGLWMLWRALSHGHHHKHEGEAVGVMAGLIPCPLTLFVMTFAIARGVPAAGILFAGPMMIGVPITLSAVGILSILLRERLVWFVEGRSHLFEAITQGVAGIVLAGVAVW
ncbi:hypothetical protein NKI66_03125 [Mesorhizobium sp. M0518]|uniref:urease accessory protein UreH domain-containing protein n=1 Tax=Mesorhizobium sp. M0518 TaxID=2956956 RepID=UPI0033383FD9